MSGVSGYMGYVQGLRKYLADQPKQAPYGARDRLAVPSNVWPYPLINTLFEAKYIVVWC